MQHRNNMTTLSSKPKNGGNRSSGRCLKNRCEREESLLPSSRRSIRRRRRSSSIAATAFLSSLLALPCSPMVVNAFSATLLPSSTLPTLSQKQRESLVFSSSLHHARRQLRRRRISSTTTMTAKLSQAVGGTTTSTVDPPLPPPKKTQDIVARDNDVDDSSMADGVAVVVLDDDNDEALKTTAPEGASTYVRSSSLPDDESATTTTAVSVLPPMIEIEEGEGTVTTNAKKQNNSLRSANVWGPVGSVLTVTAFLLFTLLESGSFGDAFQSMDFSHKFQVISKISWLPSTQVPDAQWIVMAVMAFSAFAQALTGFGFAVVAVGALSGMPWLLHSELYDVVTPVAATLGALVGFILLIPYAVSSGSGDSEDDAGNNPGLDWPEILSLLVPCTLLTPVGDKLHDIVDPLLGTRVLAALIMGFVSYKLYPMIITDDESLLTSGGEEAVASVEETVVGDGVTGTKKLLSSSSFKGKEPKKDDDSDAVGFLQSRTGAILMGSLAGIFGGAFDVQGPPLCVYGDAKGWSPSTFRNNVLTVVALNSTMVVLLSFFKGNLSDFYYSYFCLTSLPGVLLGIAAGQYASERIDPGLFKNLVLVMCFGLGIQLLTVS